MSGERKAANNTGATTILVIDDDTVVLDSVTRIFTEAGYHIVTTTDPREGLELAENRSFDAVLCDWNMPELSGTDVIEILGTRAPDSAVVMITGYPSVEHAVEGMKRGATEFVAKPFEPKEIVDAVDRAINRKRTMQQQQATAAEHLVRSLDFPVPDMEDKSPHTIAETVAQKVGVGKTTAPWLSVLLLGILAGAYIGFGGMLAATVTFDMAPIFGIGFTKFMTGSVFSLGLMLVIIAGAELFTGNNLMVSSVMAKEITIGRMLERWGLVYVANFIGSILVALIFVLSGLWKTGGGELGEAAVRVAYGKVTLPFVEALIRAIGCNWLVCLAVWMAMAARQTIGKIFAIFFPIMGFVAIGFEHSVANMYFIPTGLFLQAFHDVSLPTGASQGVLTWGAFFVKNLVPVTIGNIIGGGVFVAMSYWSAYLRPAGDRSK